MPATFTPCALMLGLMLACGLAQASEQPDPDALAARQGIPQPAVIAHRGASFDAPESTAASYTLARDLGADYLEMDLQRSKDGVLFALHDNNLQRTTDVAQKFPERKDSPANAFTMAELKTLDAGSWFNQAHPERARPGFAGLKILTLDEIIDIAQGNAQHKPGLYIETKEPQLFPGIEHDLKEKLQDRGWLSPAGSKLAKSELAVGQGKGKVVLQTFDKHSLELLHQAMPNVPKVLLLWVAPGSIEPASGQSFASSGETDKAAFYARQQPKDQAEFKRWVDFAKAQGAIGTGPSAALTGGGEQSYSDLVQPWMNQYTHDQGLLVHVYTIDEPVDFKKVMDAGVDGIFTNRSAELLKYFKRPASASVAQLLDASGY
ncbi:glycerophosphodiester phosphodiesterase [Pseudomonas protegens]|jgi:glycerophosphoryl diester phosphodiesterase|uniref:Glycerophosphodiester phosphodiesterase family protein n=3 Tax=Pseudomonas protegens TaxID=380021 RepID=Q4K810_PSEF5|nr:MULTISPECIES: glycerophosphodiester phosphodiesterase [Pseudomonas]AAY93786.1 glycerophosphodiester phosphodiesterase family protein [Pseudomonas protegens Pf-5]AGL86362.1 glycerophosphoryl diester phosphodiesterase GlpQ [Pseudomonas protegens CHA0]ASE22059.1 glycerophosphodiester phosphodiesterase [Pseudomonas protegens]MBP5109153.1 glycerophosphodiester phosphodiesterase [Pseudomonas protegens]MBP5116580.1 glycerophosphodiester phosphodiesterase [Pseudomonas protegens]